MEFTDFAIRSENLFPRTYANGERFLYKILSYLEILLTNISRSPIFIFLSQYYIYQVATQLIENDTRDFLQFSEYFQIIFLYSISYTDDIVFFAAISTTRTVSFFSPREWHKEFGGTKGSARVGTSEQVIESRYFTLCSTGCCSCIHRSPLLGSLNNKYHRRILVFDVEYTSECSFTNSLFPYISFRENFFPISNP